MPPVLTDVRAELMERLKTANAQHPQYNKYITACKLAKAKRNTGKRGITWFSKGDILLCIPHNEVIRAYSFNRVIINGVDYGDIGWCQIPANSVKFYEES